MVKRSKTAAQEPGVSEVAEEPKKKKLKKKKVRQAVPEEPVAAQEEAPKKKKKLLKKKKRAAAPEEPVAVASEPPPKKVKAVEAEPEPDESGSDSEQEVKATKSATKKAEPAKAEGGDEEWANVSIKCIDCSEDFEDTAEDQEFRWNKGFTEAPKRCKDCRLAKKQRVEGKDGDGKGKGKKGKDGKGKDGKGKKGKDGKGKGKDGKGKGGGICYKFQAGNCTFTDCKFSHTN